MNECSENWMFYVMVRSRVNILSLLKRVAIKSDISGVLRLGMFVYKVKRSSSRRQYFNMNMNNKSARRTSARLGRHLGCAIMPGIFLSIDSRLHERRQKKQTRTTTALRGEMKLNVVECTWFVGASTLMINAVICGLLCSLERKLSPVCKPYNDAHSQYFCHYLTSNRSEVGD